MIAQTKKVGDIELTALSDGRLATSLDVILGMDRVEAARLAGTTGDNLHIAVNAFLLKLAGKWALIDVGAGDSMGPELGRLAENLRTFGVAPEEIAADRLKVAGAHMDFPGFGTIVRRGAGFAFEPEV